MLGLDEASKVTHCDKVATADVDGAFIVTDPSVDEPRLIICSCKQATGWQSHKVPVFTWNEAEGEVWLLNYRLNDSVIPDVLECSRMLPGQEVVHVNLA